MNEQITAQPSKAFIVRMTRKENDAVLRNHAIEQGIIAVGWSEATDLLEQETWGVLKKSLRTHYPKLYGNNENRLGNAAGSVWRFIREEKADAMGIGCYVLLPTSGAFHLGICTSEPYYSEDEWAVKEDMQWQRKVNWLTKGKPISRSATSQALESRLKVRQTCVDVSKFIQDINHANENRERISFDSHVLEQAKSAVSQVIETRLNPDQLERLIQKLCEKSGAIDTEIPSKNSPLQGDADVVATYPITVGLERKFVKVAYQVKRHEEKSTTSTHAVNQIRERLKAMAESERDSSIVSYLGCVITTADKLSDHAELRATGNDDEDEITVMTRDELIEWILKSGVDNLSV